jgi:hypothetical protein
MIIHGSRPHKLSEKEGKPDIILAVVALTSFKEWGLKQK